MLTDVKKWLETTGYKVAEERFLVPPPLPYILFSVGDGIGGSDTKNCIASRGIRVEFYSEKINREAESKIEALLNEKAIHYLRDRIWIDSEKFFETIYDFNIVEKL